MNRRLLHYRAIAFGVVGATAVTLLVTGCAMTADKNNAVGASTTSTSSPPSLGRGEEELSAGVHVLDLVALDNAGTGPSQLPRIAITLPSGWSNYEGYAVTKPAMGLAFWDVDQVYATPCKWKSGEMVDPGTTVNGLASALAAQPFRNATTPTDVVLAGVRGKYLRLSVPKHIDFARCHRGYFESWTGLGWSSDRWEQGPGQVDRIWILNVDGQRLVVDANYLPSATTQARAELDRIVHSIRFLGATASATTPVSVLIAAGHKPPRRNNRNGAWIAYATAPARNQNRSDGGRLGSDVYIVHPGGQPQLVASRGSGTIWNICPVFSPNGRMLAFGQEAPGGQAIIVVGVTREGTIGAPSVTLKVPGNRARCPKWSSDSSRLAYLDGRGNIVVRGLDGSTLQRAAGDPTLHDFARNPRELLSPTGKLVARLSPSGTIVVSRPDGSNRRIMKKSLYAIAGWSPDGRRLLIMTDGAFMMRAVSVRAPFTTTRIVNYIPVNNARSWPAHGDVSWQPRPAVGALSDIGGSDLVASPKVGKVVAWGCGNERCFVPAAASHGVTAIALSDTRPGTSP